MDLTIQYIVIGAIFIGALIYVVKRFMPSKSKKGACGKGCGCAMTDISAQQQLRK